MTFRFYEIRPNAVGSQNLEESRSIHGIESLGPVEEGLVVDPASIAASCISSYLASMMSEEQLLPAAEWIT
jgi:hypothetical protein